MEVYMNKIKIIPPYYSGEFTMGTVTQEFIEYWSNKEEHDLLEYLHEVNWSEDFESASPTETGTKDRIPFYEIDDIEHFNMPYTDSGFMYVNDVGEEIEFKPYPCNVRYIDNVLDLNPNTDDVSDYTPVLVYATTEKGDCGHWSVELDNEEFDKNKFVISTVQTALGRFVDGAWYGNSDEELYFDTGDASTMTKATSTKVGWLHKSWSLKTKDALLEKVLKAKNNHVNLDKQGSIQGFDLSKYT